MTQPAARTGHLVRFVLLACTLIGLAAMHSLGHDPSSMQSDGGHSGHSSPTTAVLAPPAAQDGCTSDTCDQQTVTPAGHGNGHMPGWQVCLAVVTALSLAVVLGLLLFTRTSRAHTRIRSACRATSCRAPPARRLGLHLASVSVLRT
ncbi:hypothetical protein KBX08_07855 [Micromonospora sp. H61]|uniref:DUF6153 family protein n=1 Tax=Micromonospora sp. H61 TaxID=2824888 RepID=UPI001B38B6CF|nr:DUF6153 family protein [Micromonospora sp. H61]MBQ0990005.1 hypothetical protein [Micromonospora sp. H61]